MRAGSFGGVEYGVDYVAFHDILPVATDIDRETKRGKKIRARLIIRIVGGMVMTFQRMFVVWFIVRFVHRRWRAKASLNSKLLAAE